MSTDFPTFRRPLAATLVVIAAALFAAACTANGSSETGATSEPPAAETAPADPYPGGAAPYASEAVTDTVELPDPAGQADGQFAARVNGVEIPLDEYRLQAFTAMGYFVDQGLDPSTEEGQEQLKAVRKQVLDDIINQALIDQYAEEHNIQVTDSEVDASVQTYIDNLGGQEEFDKYLETARTSEDQVREMERRSLIGKKVVEEVVGEAPKTAPYVRARHILCDTRQDCEAARERVEGGEDFASVAEEVSKDVTTKSRGGDLEWVTRGMLPGAAFEDVIFGLEPGELSQVVDSEFGFHVVEVLEIDEEREMDEAQRFQVQEKLFLDWVREQRDSSDIEILIPDLAALES
jgi:parvulin-like peptidyl-prolyl isomerase